MGLAGVWRRVIAVIACGCVAAGVAGVSPAEGFADSPLSWSAPALIDPGASLSGVSCPSVSLCVAVDRAGNVVTSTSPAGGASAWRIAHIDPTAPACPTLPGCHGLTGVSCASVALCVAVDDQGYVITSTEPTGGASAWHPANVDSSNAGCGVFGSACHGLRGVSCASVSACVAVDAGNVIVSTDPTAGASAWHSAAVDQSAETCTPTSGCFGLTGVSCPSASLCVAVHWAGNVVSSTNPTSGSGAWTVTAVSHYPNGLLNVSCASSLLCVAVGYSGDVFTATDPAGARAWTPTNVDGNGSDRYLAAVSCAFRTSLCVALDSG